MKAAVVQAAIRTSTGTQDFTDAQFSSDIKAFLGLMTSSLAVNTNTADLRLSEGMYDGTTQALISNYSQDAVADSVVRKSHSASAAVGLIPDGTTFTPLAAASFVATGTRLTFSAASVAQLLSTLMIGGSDVTAVMSVADMNNASAVVIAHGLGSTPDLVLCLTHGSATTINASRCIASFGAYAVANATYICQSLDRQDAAATETLNGALRTDCIAHDNQSAYTVTMSAIGSANMTATPSASAGTDRLTFLCFKITNASVKTGTFNLPTTLGEFDAFSLDKEISWAIFLNSRQTATGSGSADANGLYGRGFAAKTAAGVIQQAVGVISSDAGATTTVNKSQTNATQVIRVLSVAGSSAATAEVEDFQSSGNCRMNLLTTDGAAYTQGYIAVGNASVVPTLGVIPTIQAGVQFVIPGTFPETITSLTIGGVAQTIDSQDGTSLTCTPVVGSLYYVTNYPLIASSANGSAVSTAQIQPPASWSVRNITLDINEAYRLKKEGGGTLVGAQVRFDSDVDVFEDASYQALGTNPSFDYYLNSGTGEGTLSTITRADPAFPPVLVGPIPDFIFSANSGLHFIPSGTYFTGAVSYASGSLQTGITFDVNTGAYSVDTSVVLGNYSNRTDATNAQGTTQSNTFAISVVAGTATDDIELQDLLDPGENFTGVLITARADCPPVISYYCQPILIYPGRAKWIDVPASMSNAEKAAHILDVLEIPI